MSKLQVVLSGGGCRMVSIQNMIAAEFPSAEICKRIAPDEAIAVGSAIEADILHSRQVDCDEKHLKPSIKLPTLSKNIDIQVRKRCRRARLGSGACDSNEHLVEFAMESQSEMLISGGTDLEISPWNSAGKTRDETWLQKSFRLSRSCEATMSARVGFNSQYFQETLRIHSPRVLY